MIAEKWKNIPEFPGFKASDLGRIKRPCGKIVTGTNAIGYRAVVINKLRKRVHRLVLFAFVGPCPLGKECAHLNGNRSDNRLVNLKWVSHQENVDHQLLHGTRQFGETASQAKLTTKQVLKIKAMLSKGIMSRTIAKSFGITEKTIGDIKMGRSWTHLKAQSAQTTREIVGRGFEDLTEEEKKAPANPRGDR